MQLYLAPLQGLTDWIFREAFCRHIGGIDKTFTPFVRVQQGEFYRPTQCKDLLHMHNQWQKPVPQFLGKDAASFQKFETLCLAEGYDEVNINMGCPYPMVTGKHMGAGILTEPEIIERLLSEIADSSKTKISVKCRLGMENTEEFEKVAEVLNAFQLTEVIIHPRVGKQQYKGAANPEAFAQYASRLNHKVVYNGDILTVADMEAIKQHRPETNIWMLGRGLLRNPFLAQELKGNTLSGSEKSDRLERFHFEMLELCGQKYENESQYLRRFEELWSYHADWYENGHKLYKMVKKSKNRAQYESVIKLASQMVR